MMRLLTTILLLWVSLIPLTLPGCSPLVVEEIAQGVTEGVMEEIETFENEPKQG